jgi:putative hemolysin
MEQLRSSPHHVAFVVDEFGGLEGLLTPTDLLEMIAGDFPESHDAPGAAMIRREDGSYLVDGKTDLLELSDALDEAFDAGSFHTAAGLVLNHLGRLPEEGVRLVIGSWRVEVVDMDGRRIDKLLFTPSAND